MTAAVLTVDGVHKDFGTTPVLRGIDLEVDDGQAVALIGGSGSGKSTLLRCINLLEQVTDGVITLDGEGHHRSAGEPRRDPKADR